MKRILLYAFILFSLSTYAQRGYWVKSAFIELKPSMSSRYSIQILDGNIFGRMDENIQSTFTQIHRITHNGFIVEAESSPTNKNWYISKAYRSPSTDETFVRPRIAVSIKDGCPIVVSFNLLQK